MANLTEVTAAFSSVYKIEKTDPVLGGDGLDDVANKQAHALMQRDNYLKQEIEAFPEDIIKAFIPSYVTNDLYILHGCLITANIPGTSSITAGAIFYNGKKYKVAANPSISSPSNTLVFSINTSTTPHTIVLSNGASGSGIANYNASTVKRFLSQKVLTSNVVPNELLVSMEVPTGCSGGIDGIIGTADTGIAYSKLGDLIRISGSLFINVPDLAASDEFGTGYPAGFFKLNLQDAYKGIGQDGGGAAAPGFGMATCFIVGDSGFSDNAFSTASAPAVVNIDSDGNIKINNIPPPGADKQIRITFTVQYIKKP